MALNAYQQTKNLLVSYGTAPLGLFWSSLSAIYFRITRNLQHWLRVYYSTKKIMLFVLPPLLSHGISLPLISPIYNYSGDYCLFGYENKIKTNLRFILILCKFTVRSQNDCRKIAVNSRVIVKLHCLMLIFNVIVSWFLVALINKRRNVLNIILICKIKQHFINITKYCDL